jgi:hypothetical protein
MTTESQATMAAPTAGGEDLSAALQRVLQSSDEPLTVPKIRAKLPTSLREANLEEVLQRQVAARVLHQYPKYRSPQDRFWDRPMEVHIAALIRSTLESGPLNTSELRRKLPAYAQGQADAVLEDMLAKNQLHQHPRLGGRTGERIGVRPADPKDYLQPELSAVFTRLQPLGFRVDQLRAAALEILHNEEWAPTPPEPRRRAEKPTDTETPAAAPTEQATPEP